MLVIMGPSSGFLLVLIGITFISTRAIPVPECPPDQVYNECGSACYSPCGERDPDLMCTDQCVPGCFCKPGFTFLEGSNKNKCVPCNQTHTVPECPPDQVYNECESACYSTCRRRDSNLKCTQQCVPGCSCKHGLKFLEGSKKTKCVPCNFIADRVTRTFPWCPPDQIYECVSACYAPCGDRDPDIECTGQCTLGCHCKPGFTFLEGSKNKCVPCNPTQTVPECPPDQEYNECRSDCYTPCGERDPDLMCSLQCITGCFCKPGFSFLEGSNKTECVPCNQTQTVPNTVPECPPDQVYNECGSACYTPCGERDPDRICTQQCIAGCFCKPGFKFLEGSNNAKCVPCNQTHTVPDTECPPDQEYECRSACATSCGNVEQPQMCPAECIPGCFCKPGFRFLEGSNETKCVSCNPSHKVPECPPDQEYECRSACYSPCGELDPDLMCTDQCVSGCYCKPGFTFLEGSDVTECVPCNPTHTVPECPPDQEYVECRSACYSPCGVLDPDLMCTDQCVSGCFCKPGFTFLEGSNNAICVPCNPTHTVPDECPPDQVYNECGSACYSPCGIMSPDLMCTQQCVPGCFCKPGFTFPEWGDKSRCVPCKFTLRG